MLLYILLLSGGFFLLYIGADWLVTNSASLARSTGIKPVVIGVTIIAFGTSAPEFIVSIAASLQGRGEVVLGNDVGSCIANIGLILGISAFIRPLTTSMRLVKKELPIALGSLLLLLLTAINLRIGRVEGVVLSLGICTFAWYCVKEARADIATFGERLEREYEEYVKPARSKPVCLAFILLGLTLLGIGSHLAVKGGVGLAEALHIPSYVIAASLIAVGTSLPELATSVVAAAKGEADISIGNVIGSNIFDVLACIGIPAAIRPIAVDRVVVMRDIPFAIGITIILGLFMITGRRTTRSEGLFLLAIYGVYIYHLTRLMGGAGV